jgi:predicted short-subunit dehydrogenase-like oxidoreductase (DUF2520 family)
MLPGMAGKPRITIVGAGNLGSALAVALHRAGYDIDEVISRPGSSSLTKAKSLAKAVGARAVPASQSHIKAQVVWFCVPDGEIAGAARSLAGNDWKGTVALHTSGAFTSDELTDLRRRGAAVASAHPLMTFVRGSRPSLAGIPFAVEGDRAAVRTVRLIIADLRGQAFPIRKREKVAYHAWGTFASPLLTALLATTEQVAAAAGVKAGAARRRMLPIIAQTVANYAALGAAGAFSGPLVRGDAKTVKGHLRALRAVPAARDAYVALGKAALHYLPVKNKRLLEEILNSRSVNLRSG